MNPDMLICMIERWSDEITHIQWRIFKVNINEKTNYNPDKIQYTC